MAAVLLFASSAAQAAEIKVLSGNGSRAAVRELCTQFEKATGHKIDLSFGVNPEVKSKIEAGERFDVVVGNPPIIDALIKDGTVVGPRVDFGHAGLGVAVKSGAPKPDISSVEAFKRALLASNAVAFPGKGASGIYFVSLLDRMGIKAEMQSKLKPMAAEDTVEVVARGEADMVVVVSTRISDVPGVDRVRANSGGIANENRICRWLKRFDQGAGRGQGVDPFSQCARRGTDAASQGRRSSLIDRWLPLPPAVR